MEPTMLRLQQAHLLFDGRRFIGPVGVTWEVWERALKDRIGVTSFHPASLIHHPQSP